MVYVRRPFDPTKRGHNRRPSQWHILAADGKPRCKGSRRYWSRGNLREFHEGEQPARGLVCEACRRGVVGMVVVEGNA